MYAAPSSLIYPTRTFVSVVCLKLISIPGSRSPCVSVTVFKLRYPGLVSIVEKIDWTCFANTCKNLLKHAKISTRRDWSHYWICRYPSRKQHRRQSTGADLYLSSVNLSEIHLFFSVLSHGCVLTSTLSHADPCLAPQVTHQSLQKKKENKFVLLFSNLCLLCIAFQFVKQGFNENISQWQYSFIFENPESINSSKKGSAKQTNVT